MTLRRLLFLVLMLGVAALGAPAPAGATPHHPPPADCESPGADKTLPGCVQTCLSRPICPPAPVLAAAPVPAPASLPGLLPVDDRLPGRLIGPEPPPPRG
jgi:hypothetical protein